MLSPNAACSDVSATAIATVIVTALETIVAGVTA